MACSLWACHQSFASLLYWSPAEKHATKVYLSPLQETRLQTHVRKLLFDLCRELAVFYQLVTVYLTLAFSEIIHLCICPSAYFLEGMS
jgi:hypothetical protein